MPKYMNCHYGQSRIFNHAHCKIPLNLQFFAESGEGVSTAGGASGADGTTAESGSGEEGSASGQEQEKKTPTYEELVAELAKERAESQRQRNLKDTASKEAAEYKKQLRAKLSAEEQESIAKQEADAAKDARIKELEEKMAIIDNTAFWGGKSIEMDESLAKQTAEAEAKGDKDKFRELIGKHIKAVRDSAYQQALKDRPDIAAGHGSADKTTMADELAIAAAKRRGGVDENILKHYRR